MAATKADYTGLSQTGEDIAAQWPEMVRALQALALYFTAKVASGTEPNDVLDGVVLGDVAWRVLVSGSDLLVQENTGTTGSPTWTTRNTFSATSGLGALAASAITSGTFADARISESSVTQHEGALTHGNLGGLTSGDPHTQYAKKAGDTFSGTATFSASPPVSGVDFEDLGDGPNNAPSAGHIPEYDGTRWESSSVLIDQKIDDTSDQTDDAGFTTGAGERAVTWDSPDAGNGIAFPNADGVKNYDVDLMLLVGKGGSAGVDTIRFRRGATGTTSDASIRTFEVRHDPNDESVVRLHARVSSPTASEVLTVTIEAAGSTSTVRGGATTAGRWSTIRMARVP